MWMPFTGLASQNSVISQSRDKPAGATVHAAWDQDSPVFSEQLQLCAVMPGDYEGFVSVGSETADDLDLEHIVSSLDCEESPNRYRDIDASKIG